MIINFDRKILKLTVNNDSNISNVLNVKNDKCEISDHSGESHFEILISRRDFELSVNRSKNFRNHQTAEEETNYKINIHGSKNVHFSGDSQDGYC